MLPRSPLHRVVRWLHQPPAVQIILLIRAGLAAMILLAPSAWHSLELLTGLLLGQLYFNRRFYDIVSNADAMFFTCLLGLWVGYLPGASHRAQAAGLLFIAIYVLMAYFSTGWSKLTSAHWRNGTRLTQLFQQGGRGFAPVGRLLAPTRPWPILVTWSVILLELAFPLAPVLPSPLFYAMLGAGLCFHAAVAVTMGIHDFFWAFSATYPALWFAHRLIGA